MAEAFRHSFGPDLWRPWWSAAPFQFLRPEPIYHADLWRQAVMRHQVMRDFLVFLRGHIHRFTQTGRIQEQLDQQGHWFPLTNVLLALDLSDPPDGMFPLPQPRSATMEPNEWILSVDWDVEDRTTWPPILIPLGLIASRLAPHSPRPIAHLIVVWLAYCVLPVCAQFGGPRTWPELDYMLNPVTPLTE